MEEPGEQYTVVFALIYTGPASECECMVGGGGVSPPPSPTSRIRNNLYKDDIALFSRFLHGRSQQRWCRQKPIVNFQSFSPKTSNPPTVKNTLIDKFMELFLHFAETCT